MSKILMLILSSIISLEAVQWLSLEEGIAKAKKSHKLVMIDAVRNGCHFCLDMDENVFSDTKMSRWIESCFIPVKVNLSYESLPKDLKVHVTPTFMFVDKNMKLHKTIQGSWSSKDFKDLSRKLCKE